jgi:O-antigen/teichoic acid export membrane protein
MPWVPVAGNSSAGIVLSAAATLTQSPEAGKRPAINALPQIKRLQSLFRLRAFDTSTAGGRSKERFRRAAMTAIFTGMARVIGLLATLITVPLTYSYLGPERYGLWMVLISIISVMGFADLGIGNGLMNAVSEAYGKDDRSLAKEYVTSAFVMMLGIAAILTAAGAAGYSFVPWMRLFNVTSGAVAAEGARAFLVLFCWFVLSIPLGVVTRTQAGLQQGYFPQIVGAFGSIVSLLALLLVIALHGSLALLVLASTFGAVAATVLNGWLLFREHPWLLPSWHAYRRSSADKILKLGLLFFVLQCAFAVSYSSDNIVIAQVMGAAAVAIYAVPQKLFSIATVGVSMGLDPLWPAYGEALARGDTAWVRRVFFASLRITLAISVPLCAFLVLAAPWILRVAVGKSLNAPISLLVTLAVWGVVASVSGVTSMLLNGAGIMKEQAIVSAFASLSNLALSIIFTRRLGVMGVCLGSIVTQLLITLPVCFFLIRLLFQRLEQSKEVSSPKDATSLA